MATYDFKNALVLVTGAASGMGQETAKHFANAGATVIVADINYEGAKSTVQELKGPMQHTAFAFDCSNEADVKKLADSIQQKYNRLPSIIIHAAGIITMGRKSIFDITQIDWNRAMDVNLKGTFLINQMFGKLMRDQNIDGGSIVNFASIAAKSSFPHLADYCASKAGIVSLTQNFAHELAPFNIRVNAVAPAAIQTPMLADAQQKKIAVPMGRIGRPDEVARLCLFLASQESSYITGQTITISGGM